MSEAKTVRVRAFLEVEAGQFQATEDVLTDPELCRKALRFTRSKNVRALIFSSYPWLKGDGLYLLEGAK